MDCLYQSGPGPDWVQMVPARFIYLFIQDQGQWARVGWCGIQPPLVSPVHSTGHKNVGGTVQPHCMGAMGVHQST